MATILIHSNPQTTIQYALHEPLHVKLSVYDIFGQEVLTLVDRLEDAGYKSVQFNASNLASGVYFYRWQAGKFTAIRKMLLVR